MDKSELVKLYIDMASTHQPSADDYAAATERLGKILEINKASERPPHEELVEHIRFLLSGELFPPNEYVSKSGLKGVWDDRDFFKQMLKAAGKWSPAQEALLRRRFNYYDQNMHQLQKANPELPVGRPAPMLGDDETYIPF